METRSAPPVSEPVIEQVTEPVTEPVSEVVYEECDTIFFQGNRESQTQVLKYVGKQKLTATTGETMWCNGINNLKPLNVIYKAHLAPEIADVDLNPYDSYASWLNPIKWYSTSRSKEENIKNGFHFLPPPDGTKPTVSSHSINVSLMSAGQETDMQSHRRKYEAWMKRADKSNSLILWGVSRGTAATFCAFEREKYPEVKLVVLEAAIDSVEEVLPKIIANNVDPDMAVGITNAVNKGLTLFHNWHVTKYDPEGPSPMKSVANFPEGVPVVFITSKADDFVPSANTERLAQALAYKGKNEVFLLKLERSSHPNYMFDDEEDRDNYETFIHAIYKKYGLKHDAELAAKGEDLVEKSRVVVGEPEERSEMKM